MSNDIKTSQFDLKKNSKPVDSVANRVVYQKGCYNQFKPTDNTVKHSSVCFPIREIPVDCENMTGKKRGSFTVIGLYNGIEVGKRAKGKKRSIPKGYGWVVRCCCGKYEIRSKKAINNENNNKDCCLECRRNRYTRNEN